jgi:hypothetical protein
MKSETHFRPWFNVADFHREVGYGAAQATNGTWYYAAVGVAKKTDEVSAFPEGYFYLTTKSGEQEKLVLESAPAPTLKPKGDYTGMYWKATPVENEDAYFYLTSKYLAEKNQVLESSGGSNPAVMVNNAIYTGTMWKIVDAGDGYCYLTSKATESTNKVLEGNVGQDAGASAMFQGAPYMVDKASAGPGALWKFVPIP